jgi:hypothetical protein
MQASVASAAPRRDRESSKSLFENFGRSPGWKSFEKLQANLEVLRDKCKEDRFSAYSKWRSSSVGSRCAWDKSPCRPVRRRGRQQSQLPPVHRKLFVAEAEQPEATVAFMRYDRDGSGFIGKSELAAFFEDVGIVQSTKTGATEEPGPVASARRMGLVDRAFELADEDGDGLLSLAEFSKYHGRFISMLQVIRSSPLLENFKKSSSAAAHE